MSDEVLSKSVMKRHAAQNPRIAQLERELADLRKQLEPMECGHRRCEWVVSIAKQVLGSEVGEEAYCRACAELAAKFKEAIEVGRESEDAILQNALLTGNGINKLADDRTWPLIEAKVKAAEQAAYEKVALIAHDFDYLSDQAWIAAHGTTMLEDVIRALATPPIPKQERP
jgi:hypothetical protein